MALYKKHLFVWVFIMSENSTTIESQENNNSIQSNLELKKNG
jgi:hypothetical protein